MRPTDQDISNSRFTQLFKAHLYDNQIDLSLGLSSNLNLGVPLISSIQESGQLHCELYVFHLASSGPTRGHILHFVGLLDSSQCFFLIFILDMEERHILKYWTK